VHNPDQDGVVYAVDEGQAKRIITAARGFMRRNPKFSRFLVVGESKIKRVEKRMTRGGRWRLAGEFGSVLIESSELASAEGVLADFAICEQLESWPHHQLWESVITRAHKRGGMKVLVIANAPASEEDWHFQLRERVRRDPRWRWLSVTIDDVAWLRPEDRETARTECVFQETFDRLYYNIAGAGEEGLFSRAQVDALVAPLMRAADGRSKAVRRIALSLDLGLKDDPSVLCALGETPDGDHVLLRMTAWQPEGGAAVDIQEVESEVTDYWHKFRPDVFIYDPWQFEGSAQTLRKGEIMEAVPFQPTAKNNSEMARQLWRRGIDGRLKIYKGAGYARWRGEDWDLVRELKTVRIREKQDGFFRLETKGRAKKDRVISLAMASWWLAGSFEYRPDQEPVYLSEEEGDEFVGKREMQDLDFGDKA
jgi:hypothetical protein